MTHGVAVSVRHEADGNLRYRVAFLVVVVDDRRFRGKGFQFRNQFANLEVFHIIPRDSYARPTVWGMKSPAGGGRGVGCFCNFDKS